MKTPIRQLCSVLLLAAIAGCSGGGNTVHSSANIVHTGRATFTVTWPAPTRLIPAASNSIKVEIKNGATTFTSQILTRPSGGGTTTATFDPLPTGNLTVAAIAYPQGNGTGVGQATATVPLAIHAGQNTPFSLTMASTIHHLTLSQTNVTLQTQHTKQLVATALDASGNVVLTSALKWSINNPSTATVSNSGLVTGISPGTAQITVNETEAGKSISTALTVTQYYQPVVAYQIDQAHSGQTSFGTPLTFPSSATWTKNLGGKVSYPLVVGGIVYVTTSKAELYALDVATGANVWGPVAVGASWSGIAYENGKLFVVNWGGGMQAYDAVTGVLEWSIQLPGQFFFTAPPTALNGIVFTSGAESAGTLYAVDENSGTLLWTAHVANGDSSSPAVTSDGVFVSYPYQAYKFAPTTGDLLWHYNGPGDGGGGATPVYANGRVYVRDWVNAPMIFDAATGQSLGTFNAGPAPAIGPVRGYFQDSKSLTSGGTLRGTTLATGAILWSFVGDGLVCSAPIVIDNTVFVGSLSGNIYALDGITGTQLWSANAGSPIDYPYEQRSTQPMTGFAAAEGYLFVPAGNALTAWKLTGP